MATLCIFRCNSLHFSLAKILNEEPTEKQKKDIAELQKKLGTKYKFDCKAEATYVEQLLKDKLK